MKVNSTKKTTRYHPPEVLTALDQLSLANEELMVISRATWDNFLRGFEKYYAEFQAVVQALAALDCLHSLACLSKNKVYPWKNQENFCLIGMLYDHFCNFFAELCPSSVCG